MTSSTGKPIGILTYNTHLFWKTPAGIVDRFGVRLLYADETRFHHIVERLRNLPDIDLIGLQEVWSDRVKRQFIETLAPQFPYAHYAQDTCPRIAAIRNPGLLLLSKYPLANTRFTPFNDLTGVDWWSWKGILAADVIVDGLPALTVLLTHTQAGDSRKAIMARQSNFAQIAAVASHDNKPLVVLGDLNLNAEDDAGNSTAEYTARMAQLQPLDLFDSYRALHPDSTMFPGFTSDGSENTLIPVFQRGNHDQKRLDYVLVSRSAFTPVSADVPQDFRYVRDGEIHDLSDHDPLKVGLRFEP